MALITLEWHVLFTALKCESPSTVKVKLNPLRLIRCSAASDLYVTCHGTVLTEYAPYDKYLRAVRLESAGHNTLKIERYREISSPIFYLLVGRFDIVSIECLGSMGPSDLNPVQRLLTVGPS